MTTVTGDKALDKKLAQLKESAARKIMRPALTKGCRVAVKAMKAAVPVQDKAAKRAIGFRVKRDRDGVLQAKAGAGVGVKKAAIKKQAAKRSGDRPGVGISAANIQWFILGTADRYTGATRVRRKAAGSATQKLTGNKRRHTGHMPVQMSPVRDGFNSSASAVLSTIATEAKTRLEKEASK